ADPVGCDDQNPLHREGARGVPASSVSFDRGSLIHVLGAAIGTQSLALFRHVEKYARMQRPQRRARRRAVQRQVLLGYFDLTGVSHLWRFLSLPVTTSKKAFWIALVTGPALPSPLTRPSSSRIGVTSAAVPVKKHSSAM